MTIDQTSLWRIVAELSDAALLAMAENGTDDDVAEALLAELFYRGRMRP